MDIAKVVSTRSPITTTKVGAVLVGSNNTIISTGYNGRPSGVPHFRINPEDELKECHAEMNAVCFAARHGISTEGSTLYTTVVPCIHCARVLVQAGVRRVVTLSNNVKTKKIGNLYSGSGLEMLQEGGVAMFELKTEEI